MLPLFVRLSLNSILHVTLYAWLLRSPLDRLEFYSLVNEFYLTLKFIKFLYAWLPATMYYRHKRPYMHICVYILYIYIICAAHIHSYVCVIIHLSLQINKQWEKIIATTIITTSVEWQVCRNVCAMIRFFSIKCNI